MAFGFSTFSGAPFADLGSVSITVAVTGVEATGAVGTVVVYENEVVNVTGVSATGAIGTVTVTGKAVVSPTGVAGTGYIGYVLIWEQIVPNQTPNWQIVNDGNTAVWVEVIT